MRDRTGRTIRDGDRVRIQTTPTGPISFGTVDDANSHRAKELNCVRVCFDPSDHGGHPQFMGGENLEVVPHTLVRS